MKHKWKTAEFHFILPTLFTVLSYVVNVCAYVLTEGLCVSMKSPLVTDEYSVEAAVGGLDLGSGSSNRVIVGDINLDE